MQHLELRRPARRAMTAESIAKALGGHRAGSTWTACCPAHEDRKPSLSIGSGKDGKVLVSCHAGCDQRDVIGILRRRCGGTANVEHTAAMLLEFAPAAFAKVA